MGAADGEGEAALECEARGPGQVVCGAERGVERALRERLVHLHNRLRFQDQYNAHRTDKYRKPPPKKKTCLLDDEQEDAIIREPGGISIQMEVKFIETCAIQSGRTHARCTIGCQFDSGGQTTTWEFLLAIKRPHATTCRAWASDDADIPQIFAKMAGLGYEAIIINRKQLEDCARASGMDLSSVVDRELTIDLPSARG
eukprot:3771091-Rhodomonas_salina.1